MSRVDGLEDVQGPLRGIGPQTTAALGVGGARVEVALGRRVEVSLPVGEVEAGRRHAEHRDRVGLVGANLQIAVRPVGPVRTPKDVHLLLTDLGERRVDDEAEVVRSIGGGEVREPFGAPLVDQILQARVVLLGLDRGAAGGRRILRGAPQPRRATGAAVIEQVHVQSAVHRQRVGLALVADARSPGATHQHPHLVGAVVAPDSLDEQLDLRARRVVPIERYIELGAFGIVAVAAGEDRTRVPVQRHRIGTRRIAVIAAIVAVVVVIVIVIVIVVRVRRPAAGPTVRCADAVLGAVDRSSVGHPFGVLPVRPISSRGFSAPCE